MEHPLPLYCDVGIQLRHILFEHREDLLRRLLGYQPHTDFEFAMSRHYRLDARPVIAAGQAMYLKRRRGPNSAHDLGGIMRAERLKAMGLLEPLHLES